MDQLLHQRRNGFFVEAGAADGERFSNSLFFDKSRGWSGLLVEANPELYSTLMEKNRHCFSINACLSPNSATAKVKFRLSKLVID